MQTLIMHAAPKVGGFVPFSDCLYFERLISQTEHVQRWEITGGVEMLVSINQPDQMHFFALHLAQCGDIPAAMANLQRACRELGICSMEIKIDINSL